MLDEMAVERKTAVSAWVACAAAVVLWATGCGQATDAGEPTPDKLPSQVKTQGIQGGQVDSRHKFLVAVIRSGGRGGLCSGTLIAPNLVLTAQHCVSSLSSQYGIQCGSTTFTGTHSANEFIISTETNVLDQNRPPSEYFRAAEIYTPPGGNGVCGRDIAMIRLQGNVPSNLAQPIDPAFNKSQYTRGSTYWALGYGHTGSGQGEGTRRILKNRQVNCFADGCGHQAQSTEFIGDGGTCQGDSGGGAIADRGSTVLGALSRGASGCRSALYTTTHGWRSWIQGVAQQAAGQGGYPAPSWSSSGPDSDGDGISDKFDNCPRKANKSQSDSDGDGTGDACDSDIDGDGIQNGSDNCPETVNKGQKDQDGDGQGDACDPDRDGDGHENKWDNCPDVPNPDQKMTDADGTGDACDDSDSDGIVDLDDNCPQTPNPNQTDSNGDGTGDACDGSGSTDGGSGSTDGGGSTGSTDGGGSGGDTGTTDGGTTSGSTDGSGSGGDTGTTGGSGSSGSTDGSGSGTSGSTDGGSGSSGSTDGGTTSGSGGTTSGSDGGSGTTSGGETTGQDDESQPVLIVDDGNETESACSASGDGHPIDWAGSLLMGLLAVGFARVRRR